MKVALYVHLILLKPYFFLLLIGALLFPFNLSAFVGIVTLFSFIVYLSINDQKAYLASYLASLPISRKNLVSSRYLLVGGSLFIFCLLIGIRLFIFPVDGIHSHIPIVGLLASCWTLLSIFWPIFNRFSIIWSIGITTIFYFAFIFFLTSFAIQEDYPPFVSTTWQAIDQLFSSSIGIFSFLLFSLLLLITSCLLSIRIQNKKNLA